jgi:tRNA(fMet)-specific endonuclease VapC
MFLLDTDHLSIVDRDTIEGFNLGRRLATVPKDSVRVCIITYEEQMRGWLSYLARSKTSQDQVAAYRRLRGLVEQYSGTPLLDFDERAAAIFDRIRKSRIRIGTMDLKIAAIALANGATLLTRNLSDFGRVPELRAEDWTN